LSESVKTLSEEFVDPSLTTGLGAYQLDRGLALARRWHPETPPPAFAP